MILLLSTSDTDLLSARAANDLATADTSVGDESTSAGKASDAPGGGDVPVLDQRRPVGLGTPAHFRALIKAQARCRGRPQ